MSNDLACPSLEAGVSLPSRLTKILVERCDLLPCDIILVFFVKGYQAAVCQILHTPSILVC
jgi:hypothetical protein